VIESIKGNHVETEVKIYEQKECVICEEEYAKEKAIDKLEGGDKV
jgi:hypothetical protein